MGKTTIRSGQIRDVQIANFFGGTDIYSISNLNADKILRLDMRLKNTHILRLNASTWAEGVRLTVIMWNGMTSTQTMSLDVPNIQFYRNTPGWMVYGFPSGQGKIFEFIKAGGALYMTGASETVIYPDA